MSYGDHTIQLRLGEATDDQLRIALADAEQSARKCEELGMTWHLWGRRISAIRDVLDGRSGRSREGAGETDE